MLWKILLLALCLVTVAVTTLRVLHLVGDRRLERARRSLAVGPSNQAFRPEMVEGLPDPARRYLLHAIQPDAPLASSVRLQMKGTFRTKRDSPWMPMSAIQLLVPSRGFVWQAQVGQGFLTITGGDFYAQGTGRVEFWLWGLIPAVRAEGPDIARSALGRLAIESIWVPSSLLPRQGATWEVVDEHSARVTREIDGERATLTLEVDSGGRLRAVTMPRWGNQTESGEYAYIPFGGEILAERTIAGYTIPSQLHVGWWFGTDKYFEFFRVEIESAEFR